MNENENLEKEINVLFLDDEEDIVYAMNKMFKRENFGVLATTDFNEALKVVEDKNIKLVVSDQCMPDITGVKFLGMVKEKKPDILRILLSGQADIQDVEDAINVSGIYRFIHKPCEPDYLKKVVKESIYHYDLLQKNRLLLKLAKERNAELEEINMRLSSLYEKQKEFSTVVSHELRTPLASIKTAIDIVISETSGTLNEEQNKFLNKAKMNVDRLRRLIDDVLDISKLESGKMDIHLQPNSIKKVIDEVVEVNHPGAQSAGLYLKSEIDPALPAINFDVDRISQVLNNLVTNAIKFTKEGGILITAKREGDKLVVCTRDTGAGIGPDDIPKLFKKFQQLDTKSKDGTGLGLAICKEIINQHKGKIWVESEINKGSCFCFSLKIP